MYLEISLKQNNEQQKPNVTTAMYRENLEQPEE